MFAIRRALLLGMGLFAAGVSPALAQHSVTARVFFSPRGGTEAAVVSEIGRARWSIHVLAYSFTSWPIADALLAARRRGVEVTILCDDGNETDPYSLLPWLLLQWAGVVVWEDHHAGSAHNKVMILDEGEVLTGSYNWSHAAEEDNAENLLMLSGQSLVDLYRLDWQKHLTHARIYVPRQKNGPRIR